MKTRTKRYIMTVNKGNDLEEHSLIRFRKMISFLNLHVDQKFYVKCHGRFGKSNPNAYKYKTGELRRPWSECRLEDAPRLDVYLQPYKNKKISS